ncbi:STAS domain-containing protein [Candidatus Sumerlaeota bacterium]|nr:STAS domain-containing protein [Candidatus Sumerlaeota bacterium]
MKTFDLNIRLETREKNYSLIEISGYLDAHTVNMFENRMEEILESGEQNMVLDLLDLNYISSAGIGALMSLTQRLRKKHGDLVLLRPNRKVYKILDLLGFTKIFVVALDEKEMEDFFKSKKQEQK